MRKIRSGQSFLYRNAGYDSTVIEIKMKKKVTGSYLQAALTETAARFPYMTEKLVEKDGSYYLCPSNTSMIATKTQNYRSLGSMAVGYHLLDVTYYQNLIRVAFHHGLCDGRGVQSFVETLIYEYCKRKYRKNFSAEGIHLVGEKIEPAETEEPFDTEFLKAEPCEMPDFSEKYALPETSEGHTGCYRTEFVLDEKTFIKSAKAVGATPAIFVSMVISDAILEMHPEADKPITCNMAMDLRSVVGKEKTHCNCVASVYLPYTKDDKEITQNELSAKYRELLNLQRNPELLKMGINKQIGMYNKLDTIETLEEKKQALSFFDGMINNTYVLSYLGKLRLNDYAEYIDSACFYGDVSCGMTINMLFAGDKVTLTLLQSFPGIKYAENFKKALLPYGLLSVSETSEITTGIDKSHITASKQWERFFIRRKKKINK